MFILYALVWLVLAPASSSVTICYFQDSSIAWVIGAQDRLQFCRPRSCDMPDDASLAVKVKIGV